MEKINKVKIYINGDDRSKNVEEFLKKRLIDNSFEIVDFDYNLAISIGGDGTFLKMIHDNNFDSNIYYVGINTGTLGFLEEINFHEIDNFIDLLVNSNYKVNELNIEKIDIDNYYSFNCLNEIVIRKSDSTILKSNVYVDNELLENFAGDGLLISTSTGSTACNMSFHGPIVYNNLNVLLLTPVAAINNSIYKSLTNSLIIPHDKTIKFAFQSNNLSLLVDGQKKEFQNVNSITITIDNKVIKCIRTNDFHFIKQVNSKMLK